MDGPFKIDAKPFTTEEPQQTAADAQPDSEKETPAEPSRYRRVKTALRRLFTND